MNSSTQGELERHSRELALLYEIIRSTNYHLNLQDILSRAVRTLVAGMEVQSSLKLTSTFCAPAMTCSSAPWKASRTPSSA